MPRPIIIRGKVKTTDYENQYSETYTYIEKLHSPSRHGHKNRPPAKIFLDDLFKSIEDKIVTVIITVDE